MYPIASVKKLVAVSTLALGVAFANLCSAEQPSVTVSYRDLAINTPQGALRLYGRIRSAADKVCSYFDYGDLTSKANTAACAEKAVADAVRRVGEPQLTSVYNATHKVPLSTSSVSANLDSR
jgi:UrcA family protein